MTALAAFLPWVVPFAPGVFEDQALAAIRDAAIEFCSFSELLKADLDPFAVIQDQDTYDLDAPASGTRVVRVSELRLDSLLVNRRAYRQDTPSTLTLLFSPSAGTFSGRIVYAPTRTATSVDDLLFDVYVEGIAAGALQRLLLTAGQPYSNPQGAAAYALQFNSAKSKARVAAAGGNVGADRRARSPWKGTR